MSSWRIRWPRLAPIAVRIAISRWRPAARASSRLATLAQAIRSTKPTAPTRISRASRTSPTSASRSGITATLSLLSIHLRIGAAELLARDRHIGLRGLQVRPASGVPRPANSGLGGAVRIGLQRDENVGRRIGMEGSGKNSHHDVGIASQQDRLADQRWVASEARSPKIVAQHRSFLSVGLIFLRQKGAS